MPRGGARNGSGPKKDANGKALHPYKPRSVESSNRRQSSNSSNEAARTPVIEAKVVSDNRRQPMFSDTAILAILEAARELSDRAKKRPRTREWNPYVIRNERFGPVWDHIQKSGRKRQLAMDDNTPLSVQNQFAIQAWQTGGIGPNDATDGMLFLGYPYLSELTQRAEFRLFGEITSEEMTRKWIDLRGTDDESTKEKDKPKDRNKDDQAASDRRLARDEEPRNDGRNKEIEQKIIELRQFADDLKLRQWFKSVDAQDQYFGISHLYLDLKGADINDLHNPENRLSIGNGRDVISQEKLGRNCLKGIRTIEPVWCYPIAYNASNPLSPDWYDPLVWYVMGAEVHKTRLMPFISRPVSDILKPAYAFGGLPMTQMSQPYVDIWLRTRESVAELIHAFSVMVLKTNVGVITQPGGAGGANGDVIARMMLANTLRDNQGMMIIDKNTEDFANISAPISGLDHLQAQAQEHMYSVARIPAVKWTGIQPTGLNATSEGELRAFNDTIHGRQESFFRNGLTTILDIMQISLWGKRDEDITYDFEPLHELTEKEKADARKVDAETDQIRVDTGIVSQEEVRAKLVADPDSGYHGLDPDDVPELLQEEEQGLIPEGAGKGLEAELAQGGGGGGGPAGGPRKPGKSPSNDNEGRRRPAQAQDEIDPLSLGADAEWNESDHPRRDDGKFGSGGGGAHNEPHKSGAKKAIPLKASELKRVGEQMGSNPGGVFEDKSGERYYVKKGKSKAHVRNELAAVALYQLAGVPTLDYRPVEGGDFIASKMEKLDKNNANKFSPAEVKQAQQDFVAHAWLANWDAAGLGGDNLGTINGKVSALDVGGALTYRAQGAPKGAAFGTKVGELDTLRDPNVNRDTAKLFGKMNEDDLYKSAERVTSIRNGAIRAAVKNAGEGEELADKLIARKNDIAKRFGTKPAGDAAFEESKHPRKPDGKFAPAGGGGGGSGAGGSEAPKSKKELVGNLLLQKEGTTTEQILKATGWPSVSVPAQAAAAGLKLEKKKVGGQTLYFGTPMTDAEKAELKSAAKAAKAKKEEAATPAKPAFDPHAEYPLGKIDKTPPTAAELEKAKKSAKLSASYLPEPKPSSAASIEALNSLIVPFNKKWEGKTDLSTEQLSEKVQEFKKIKALAEGLKTAENIAAEKVQKENMEAAKKAAEQAEAKKKADAQKFKEDHAEVTKELGLTSAQDLEAFDAFVDHFGGASVAIGKFKEWQKEAETGAKNNPGYGFEKLSGFEMGCISAYTGPQSGWINEAIRNDAVTPAQFMFEKVLNSAIDKLPKKVGLVRRGLSLDSASMAKLKPGVIWTHRNFASASTVGWGGNTKLHIEATGKGGAYVAPISSHKHEDETLFKSNLRLLINKTEKKGDTFHVYCKEM